MRGNKKGTRLDKAGRAARLELGEAKQKADKYAARLRGPAVCGDCGRDYNGQPLVGGMIYGGVPVGPCCKKEWLGLGKQLKEKVMIFKAKPGEFFDLFVHDNIEKLRPDLRAKK